MHFLISGVVSIRYTANHTTLASFLPVAERS